MTSRRPLIPAVLAASLALAPAAAAQAPTLQFDRTCYAEHQPMVFSGAGFTPGGPVDLLVSALDPSAVFGQLETTADATGAISGSPAAEEKQFLAEGEVREHRLVSATDRTRVEGGADPATQVASSTFIFTRWMAFSPRRLVAGRKAPVEIFGWAFAAGRPAYYLLRKGGRTVASVKVGTIAGDCGDLDKRVRVPRKVRPGAYKAYLSTDRRGPGARGAWLRVKVTRKASASAAGRPGGMRRFG